MRIQKTMLIVLFAFMLCGYAYAQEGDAFIYYAQNDAQTNPPLGCPCATHEPYLDGTATWFLYWDNNNNGPDAADVLVPIGSGYAQANFNSGPFNGVSQGIGAGYFVTESNIAISALPSSPDTARYYIQISTAGANACCWRTHSFSILPGLQDIAIQDSQWTCAGQVCGNEEQAPTAPTGVTATQNGCMIINVGWTHDGLHTIGYNVYVDGVYNVSAIASARSAVVSVSDCGPHAITVKANGSSESPASIAVTGSAWMLRFNPDSTARNNVRGYNLANHQFCVAYSRPDSTCYTHVNLYLVRKGVRIEPPLRGDSLVIRQCGTFPAGTTDSLQLLMVAYLMSNPAVVCTDTTDSLFSFGSPPNAADEHLLLPDRFELAQNFPNPFNPTTTIQFSVPYTSEVKIQVFNIEGQLVRTLAASDFSSGVYSVEWDSRSDAGSLVGAGLYFCRMTGSNFAQTHKMLLLK